MLKDLLDPKLSSLIAQTCPADKIIEIRMRANMPLVVFTIEQKYIVKNPMGVVVKVTLADIQRVLQVASNFSLYSINDELKKGFVPLGGVRIGVCGVGVIESEKIITLKDIGYLTIRVPHQVFGVADEIKKYIFSDEIKNTLIISPPCAGKTTMLRELARLSAERCNTLIIDERFEIADIQNGKCNMDVGECDVISGIAKSIAYENSIRAMNPDVIVTDELFKMKDIESCLDIIRSGVKVFASIHGDSVDGVMSSDEFKVLADFFDVAVVLSKKPKIGTIKEIVEFDINVEKSN